MQGDDATLGRIQRLLAERSPELESLCRLHERAVEMIGESAAPEELLERALDDYERQIRELPDEALRPGSESSELEAQRLLNLALLARQVAALQERVDDEARKERKRHERSRAVRMEQALKAVRVMTHRINNPLTTILGRAQMLRNQLPPESEAIRGVSVIEESASRIADLVKGLAEAARSGEEQSILDFLEANDVADQPDLAEPDGDR